MYRAFYKIISIALFVVGGIVSCKKEMPKPDVKIGQGEKVYVVCEGSLGNGNGSLTLYNTDSNKVYEDIFKSVNGQALGDIFQSMTLIGDRYFLCINNSDKIVVINKVDLKLQGVINIPKPRYILPVTAEKAYVSSIFSNNVYVINPQTMSVTSSFSLPGNNPEKMLLWKDQAVICTWDTSVSSIFYISPSTETLVKSVAVSGKAPQEILIDKEQKLWVLSGDVYRKTDAKLTRLDPDNGKILQTYSFPPGTDVVKPTLNNTKDSLYFIEVQYDGSTANNGVYRMNINAGSLPQQAFIAANSFQYFWAVNIQPQTGNIYIGDPKGFSQKGNVSIFRPDGLKIAEFKTGVGPSSFYFE